MNRSFVKVGLGILLAWATWYLFLRPSPKPAYALAADAFDRGDYSEAERYYRLTFDEAARHGKYYGNDEQYYKGVAHEGLGKVFMKRERYSEAEEEFQLAISCYSNKQVTPSASNEIQRSYQSLCDTKLRLGKCSEAVMMYERHAKISIPKEFTRDQHDTSLLETAKWYHEAGNRCKTELYFKVALSYLCMCKARGDFDNGFGEIGREKEMIIQDGGINKNDVDAVKLFLVLNDFHRMLDKLEKGPSPAEKLLQSGICVAIDPSGVVTHVRKNSDSFERELKPGDIGITKLGDEYDSKIYYQLMLNIDPVPLYFIATKDSDSVQLRTTIKGENGKSYSDTSMTINGKSIKGLHLKKFYVNEYVINFYMEQNDMIYFVDPLAVIKVETDGELFSIVRPVKYVKWKNVVDRFIKCIHDKSIPVQGSVMP